MRDDPPDKARDKSNGLQHGTEKYGSHSPVIRTDQEIIKFMDEKESIKCFEIIRFYFFVSKIKLIFSDKNLCKTYNSNVFRFSQQEVFRID